MDRIRSRFSQCICTGTTDSDEETATSPTASEVRPEPEGVDAHLLNLQSIVRAHRGRDRTQTEAEVVDWKYEGKWNVEESTRQMLRSGPEELLATRWSPTTFVVPGTERLSDELRDFYEGMLKALMAAGLDLCTVQRISLEHAYRTLIDMENRRHDISAARPDNRYETAFHRAASRYLDGLADAQACDRQLVSALKQYQETHHGLQNLCPVNALNIRLLNRADSLHLLASSVPAFFFQADATHIYRKRRNDSQWREPEGMLRWHEVEHPGSTAACSTGIRLVLERLAADAPVTLAWLDQLRKAMAACTTMSPAQPLAGPVATRQFGGATAARLNGLLATYHAAVDACAPGDERTVYQAIAALCCAAYQLTPFGNDLGMTNMALLQFLLLRHGLPAVFEMQPPLLAGPDDLVAAQLETFGLRQKLAVASSGQQFLDAL